jgi:hypothetical protein
MIDSINSIVISSYTMLITTISRLSKSKLIVLIKNTLGSLANNKSSSSFVMPFW